MIAWLTSLFRRKRPAITIVKSGWEEPAEPLGFPHEFARWMSSMYPNGFQNDERDDMSTTGNNVGKTLREMAAEQTGIYVSDFKEPELVYARKDWVESVQDDMAKLRDRIAELERENAALRHELTAVKNTLEAVGREKDELARDAERWRECERLAESQLHKRERLWTTRFVPGDTFAAAIDAAIQKRKETT